MTPESRLPRGWAWPPPNDAEPGWKADPDNALRHRWWTGRSWAPDSHPDPRTQNPWLIASLLCALVGTVLFVVSLFMLQATDDLGIVTQIMLTASTIAVSATPMLSGVAIGTHPRFGHRTSAVAVCVTSSLVVGFGFLMVFFALATGAHR